ncbi:unnamed protein product [Fusarium venenatum]|uniref:Transcription factor domain-containing protein n=1 Tax=Fusarium venenatum TaxID=56646 RepID=A0A2L2TSQ1_9HYPO|nr:uncharacterized protein FVRRES_09398 [Fusarium venenatum]CEI69321.1 unnamed protein product [Fusarium venenatum]
MTPFDVASYIESVESGNTFSSGPTLSSLAYLVSLKPVIYARGKRRCARLKTSCHYNNNGIQHQVAVAGGTRRTIKGLLPSLSEPSPSATGTATLEAPDDKIPPSLINILVELYFKNVYQSSLLLHKATFIKSLANSTVQHHVLLSMCALAANSEKLFRFEAIADVENLPLPWPDNNFEAGTPPTDIATIANGVVTGSEFAESHVAPAVRCRETILSSRIQQIFAMESKILAWWSSIPLHFKLDASAIPNAHHESMPKILLTNFVYHQSLCALHSSIVPLFSWSKGDTYQSSARQLSAQIAFEHAGAISILIRCILRSAYSMSSMPIFVAYAAYSSCAIQIPFLWCSEPAVKAQSRSNVELNAKIIQGMSSYWKLASLLKVYVRCIHDVHKANPPNISNEPRYTDSSAFLHFGADSDLAKASILEFTGILRSSEGGYVKPGEESRDLMTGKISTDLSAQMSLSSNASLDEMVHDTHLDISTMAALDSQVTDLSGFSSEWPALDVINSLMDADLTSAFAMDNNIDLAGFETDFLTWDTLDST